VGKKEIEKRTLAKMFESIEKRIDRENKIESILENSGWIERKNTKKR